jgi:7-carboxy-7-deazaguanine synthase
MSLRINEIFLSIQGESTFAGSLCVFVRTTGCLLRCAWCDTQYAYESGKDMSLEEIVEKVVSFGVPFVAITGGEPLIQKDTLFLISRLRDLGLIVLLETSGACDISPVDKRAHIVMDIKCPSSGQADKMLFANIALLEEKDEVKFVLASREDYTYAKKLIAVYELPDRCPVLLSAAVPLLDPALIAEWIIADRLPVKLQLQLHKYIWPDRERGV